jgi:hypothetical protein
MPRTLCLMLIPLIALALLGGCSEPVESGFLSPYDGFQRCGLFSANLEYVNPQADWAQYKSVRILPVTVLFASDSARISPRDAAELSGFFERKLAEEFGKDYRVVSQGGPGVLEVRAAITNLRPTNVGENAAAQAGGLLLPMVWGIGIEGYKHVTGDQLGMGEAQVEAEFRSSTSGRRLYGYVARKVGSSLDVKGQMSAWGVVETALSKWAGVLHNELQYRQNPTGMKRLLSEMK